MRVLVTGAGGFVGGVVADVFARNGIEVLALYRRTKPDHLNVYRNVTLIQLDLLQFEEVPEPFDCLIHCAAEQPETTEEADMVRNNIEGTKKLFMATIDAKVQNIIYLSSRAVYGTVQVKIIDEKTPLNEPDAYGQSKYQPEKLLQELVTQTANLSGMTIRLSTMLGLGAHDNFIADVFQKILYDQPIQVKNPESLFNNVVLAKDLAGFLLKLSHSMPVGYTMTNIGAMEPIPLREVIHLLYRYSRKTEQIEYSEGGNPFMVSLEKVRKLGYHPATVRTTLERYVSETINQIR